MAVPWGLVAILIGIAYGWISPGRQQKWALFKMGALVGLVVGLVFAVIGWMFDTNPLGFGTGLFAFVVSFVILVALFVLGVWVGDMLERAFTPRRTA